MSVWIAAVQYLHFPLSDVSECVASVNQLLSQFYIGNYLGDEAKGLKHCVLVSLLSRK